MPRSRPKPSIAIGSPRKAAPADPKAAAAFEARVAEEGEGGAPSRSSSATPSERKSGARKKRRKASSSSKKGNAPDSKSELRAADGSEPENRKGTMRTPYVRKRDGVATVALTLTVPATLARDLKVHAAMVGAKTSEVGAAALAAYLEQHHDA